MSIRLEARNRGNIRLDMDNASLAAKYAREAGAAEKAAELSAANAAGAAERADAAAEAALRAEAGAQSAAVHLPQPGENGTWLVWDQAGDSYVDSGENCSGVQGERGLKGDTGDKGDKGDTGSKGDDGVSPTVTVTDITGGHRVTITDANHPQGQPFDVMDGEVAQEDFDELSGDVDDLKSAVGTSFISRTPVFTLEQGAISSSTGAPTPSSSANFYKRVRTADFVAVGDSPIIEITIPTGYWAVIAKYNNIDGTGYAESDSAIRGSNLVACAYPYIKITFGRDDNSAFTPEDFPVDDLSINFSFIADKPLREAVRAYNAGSGVLFKGARNVFDASQITPDARLRVSNGTETTSTVTFVSGYIPIHEGEMFFTNTFLDSGTYGGVFYNADKEIISTFPGSIGFMLRPTPDIATQEQFERKIAPAGAAYVRYTYANTDLQNADAYIVSDATLTPVSFPKKVLVLGDSISYGVWTDANGTSSASYRQRHGYIYKLGIPLNWEINNQSIRGIGYVASGSFGTLTDALDAIRALADDSFDIVIVCLGINDYNTSSVTVNDIKTSVATVFSVLADKFKTARVVFLTPFNSSAAGTAATQYAYNSQKGGRTLKDIADAIIEACATNQIECHNVSANFCLNNYNITTLLGDGVHPTQDGHTVIARTLLHLFV